MSFTLTLNFNSYEELYEFIRDITRTKQYKNKQENKKKNQAEPDDNLVEVLKNDIQDKRGLHQQQYHNEAKIYQGLHPELSYREALSFVYKNKQKNI